MTLSRKTLKIASVKFIGKIGHTLIADFTYVIIYHLKSICQNLYIAQLLLSLSFIISVQICMFPLNMYDIIIYVAWWRERNIASLNIVAHDAINLLYYEFNRLKKEEKDSH